MKLTLFYEELQWPIKRTTKLLALCKVRLFKIKEKKAPSQFL